MASFRFKKFSIEQERSAMKVNTDGVLLGAWMNILGTDSSFLDVGTGSGVIAMMAAQRAAQVTGGAQVAGGAEGTAGRALSGQIDVLAIDIDEASLLDAAHNFGEFLKLDWGADVRLEALLVPFQELGHIRPQTKFDLVFSNPPYFINALKSAESAVSNARHTDTLGQGELIRSAMQVLAPQGRLALVLPSTEAQELLRKIDFLIKGKKEGEMVLHPSRICKVHTIKTKPAKRWLMEFVFSADAVPEIEHSSLIIQEGGDYTQQYKELTGPFYLNF
jgi:tRNA1Val (adenine37-N6)-methyltransferase